MAALAMSCWGEKKEGGVVVANPRWEWKFIMVNAQASSRLTYHVALMIDSMSKIFSNRTHFWAISQCGMLATT